VSLRPKFGLGIAGGDNGWASPHAAQGGGSFKAQFSDLGRQQIADFMSFEMTPHMLHWVEFRRVSRKAFQDDALSSGGDVVFDQKTWMDRRTVPQDENSAGNMSLQMPEKLHDLWAFDAALMNLKVKPPPR
jgi:hypothetical protein